MLPIRSTDRSGLGREQSRIIEVLCSGEATGLVHRPEESDHSPQRAVMEGGRSPKRHAYSVPGADRRRRPAECSVGGARFFGKDAPRTPASSSRRSLSFAARAVTHSKRPPEGFFHLLCWLAIFSLLLPPPAGAVHMYKYTRWPCETMQKEREMGGRRPENGAALQPWGWRWWWRCCGRRES